MKVTVTKENGVFSINATEIKSEADAKEVIRQCQLVESQLADGSEKFSFIGSGKSIARGSIVFQKIQ